MAGIIVACVIGIISVLVFYGSAVIEGNYQKHHPPDDDNGVTEVRDRGQDSCK